MSATAAKPIEQVRKEVRAALASLTPEQARTLRVVFRISSSGPTGVEEENSVRALAQELAALKLKRSRRG
jgi:hypothetical protein